MTDIANKGLRVAHVNRDKAGNIHAREGWIINPATEKKSTIKIVYADSGESADVPAEELRINGIASSSKSMSNIKHLLMKNLGVERLSSVWNKINCWFYLTAKKNRKRCRQKKSS